MNIRDDIFSIAKEASEWRHALHRHPQTSYEEVFASDLIARKLTEWDIAHERGWAGTGIVAIIPGQKQGSKKSIGLRADIDALNIREAHNKPWVSETDGKMHGCGHDGHTAMLLAAAKYLSGTRNFDGTVYLIFQPAEEGGNGAQKMIEESLFKKHPMDAIYGLHNWPWLPAGEMAMCPGPIMAASDYFTLKIQGIGGHAAMPHKVKDPITVAAACVTAAQNFISRELDPFSSAVISITSIHSGTGSANVIPDEAVIGGAVRALYPDIRDRIEARLEEIFSNIAAAYGLKTVFHYERDTAPTINDARQTEICTSVAEEVFGENKVNGNVTPAMTAEDFGAFLQKVPGCYVWLGQHTDEGTRPCNHGLHTPNYDFNDDVIPLGAEYWVRLVETVLKP